MGECRWVWHFFGWLWVSVTFSGQMWVSMGGYDLSQLGLGWCGRIWSTFAGRGRVCGWSWPFFGWVWVGVGGYDLFLARVGDCGWVWPLVGRVWMGVGTSDLFLTGCGWVWPFLAKCGWVWVSATFLCLDVGGCGWVWPFSCWVCVGVGECTVYNYSFSIEFVLMFD